MSDPQPAGAAGRRFRTAGGTVWEVWEVRPNDLERRFERPATPPDGVERRQRTDFRVNLGPRMAAGWLVFNRGGEQRRLAPIPAHWSELGDPELELLCERATPAGWVHRH